MNRVLNVAAMVISMVLFLMCDQLNAAVVNITQGSTSGYTMTDGNTYVIQNSVSFTNDTVGGSGMTVADNATVVLYVPAGVTLTAMGANGSGRTGGGAGIRVPKTSTLIVTGEGSVKVAGGNAGNGEDGESGYNASQYSGGLGGSGGAGGGGAGAGIGGVGGTGGAPNAGNGGVGESMGHAYVLGSICIEAFSGLDGRGGKFGGWGENAWFTKNGSDYISGGGGSGGPGGAGSSPSCPIGGGGASGGAGAKGGKGYYGVLDMWDATFWGGGGDSAREKGADYYGIPGGLAGNEGDAGVLYVSPEVTINVERAHVPTTTCAVVQYTITFDTNGGTLSSESTNITATLGCGLPDCIPTPIWRGYLLCGWKDENGTEYYDGNGKKMLTSYSFPGDVVLHAEWVIDPDRMIITPADGTIFEGSLTIAMSSSVEGTTIRYTVDGSDPTIDSPAYQKFKITKKTTIKAVAFYDDGNHSDVFTASYAFGRCADPVVSPEDGTVFEHSGQIVTIDKNGEEGVLRYTTDGTEPTRESPAYEEPFTVDDSTVVKAKVFSDEFFDSSVVMASLTRVREGVTTPAIDAASSFTGSKTKVSISCATEGAVVRYTLNGNDPNSHSTKYTGPFYVTDSCTVKAYAVMPDYLNSEVVTLAIEKVWAIGDTMGKPDHTFTTSGDGGAGWTRVTDATAPNGEAMKSGAIGNSSAYGSFARTVLSTTVMGPGTVSFSWKASCEDDAPDYEWDHGEFAVDGVVKAYVSGETGWTNVSVAVTGPGEHTLTWTYLKDDVESEGEDCIWVGGFGWESAEPYTHTTEVPVPYAWLSAHDPDVVDEYEAYEASAKKTAANGRKVWECYVVGLDPQEMDEFKISAFPMKADGTPDLENIAVDPPQSQWNVPGARAVVKGAATLDGEWKAVEEATAAEKAAMRFFKVVVEGQ